MLVKEAIVFYMDGIKGIRAADTIAWYRSILSILSTDIGEMELKTVSIDHLRRWRSRLYDNKLSVYTIHDYLRVARTFFTWLVAEKKLRKSPAASLELPKLPNRPRLGITNNDRDILIDLAKANGPRDYALVRFIGATCCRRGGAANLCWSDLDLDHCTAIVHEKGDQYREVYFGPETQQALINWRTLCPVCQSSVFGLKADGVYRVFQRLARKANLQPGWNPHNWRHGGARAMIKSGANLGVVSQLLGHKEISITQSFYGTLDGRELHEQHDKCSWID